MITPSALGWSWQVCPSPRPATAAVAWGDVATALHARIASLPESQRSRLQATAHRHGLVITGEEPNLPWVDGVAYAAPCLHAPGLWLPTLEQPDVPLDLLLKAIGRLCPAEPVLLWRQPEVLIPLDEMHPVVDMDWAAWTGLWQRH